jgi:hypothetical protein
VGGSTVYRTKRRFVRRLPPRGCAHSLICDVEASPSAHSARRARTCTRPRFRVGLAGRAAKLRSLAVFMEGRAVARFYLIRMLQRTLPAGFIAPCLPIKTTKLP